jgi:hypothetical protein
MALSRDIPILIIAAMHRDSGAIGSNKINDIAQKMTSENNFKFKIYDSSACMGATADEDLDSLIESIKSNIKESNAQRIILFIEHNLGKSGQDSRLDDILGKIIKESGVVHSKNLTHNSRNNELILPEQKVLLCVPTGAEVKEDTVNNWGPDQVVFPSKYVPAIVAFNKFLNISSTPSMRGRRLSSSSNSNASPHSLTDQPDRQSLGVSDSPISKLMNPSSPSFSLDGTSSSGTSLIDDTAAVSRDSSLRLISPPSLRSRTFIYGGDLARLNVSTPGSSNSPSVGSESPGLVTFTGYPATADVKQPLASINEEMQRAASGDVHSSDPAPATSPRGPSK